LWERKGERFQEEVDCLWTYEEVSRLHKYVSDVFKAYTKALLALYYDWLSREFTFLI
jgi:hypothetical protein